MGPTSFPKWWGNDAGVPAERGVCVRTVCSIRGEGCDQVDLARLAATVPPLAGDGRSTCRKKPLRPRRETGKTTRIRTERRNRTFGILVASGDGVRSVACMGEAFLNVNGPARDVSMKTWFPHPVFFAEGGPEGTGPGCLPAGIPSRRRRHRAPVPCAAQPP